MKYRRLGASGLKVSEIGLGSWLTFGHCVSQDMTDLCVETALDAGIDFFDTADVYADGDGESALGTALAGVRRSSYVLASKVYFPVGEGANDRGLSRKHVRESLEGSLRRLRTDYLDLYQCHRFDAETPLEELVRTMDDLITAGRILYWGVSAWTPAQIDEVCRLADAMGRARPVSDQPCHNLLEREGSAELAETCAARGLGIVAYSPLAQGLLTGKYEGGDVPDDSRAADERSKTFIVRRMTPETFAKLDRIKAVCDDIGRPMAEVALAYALRLKGMASVITGATNPEHIQANARAAELELSDETVAALEAAAS